MTVARFLVAVAGCAGLFVIAPIAAAQQPTPAEQFAEQLLAPGLASTEREHELKPKPEMFVQSRLFRGAIDGATADEVDVNFKMTRIETRWSGRLSDRIGAGVEFQFHPALEGASEEIVNDAFIELYVTPSLTVRAGQFIKPFGFDIQQSSEAREYPERGIFAGYFFPGQRDRGVMAIWDLQRASRLVGHTRLYVALLNGNRFFADNNDRLDTVIRIRRLVPAIGLTIGASAQIGSQLVPAPMADHGDVRILGLDAQYVVARVGFRAEWVRGTRPSTLLSIAPVFTDAYAPGTRTSGLATALIVRASAADQVYVRFDRLTGDPVSGQSVHATDVGYRRAVGEAAHVSVDYQWKSRPTHNDDAVNARFQATIGVAF